MYIFWCVQCSQFTPGVISNNDFVLVEMKLSWVFYKIFFPERFVWDIQKRTKEDDTKWRQIKSLDQEDGWHAFLNFFPSFFLVLFYWFFVKIQIKIVEFAIFWNFEMYFRSHGQILIRNWWRKKLFYF